VSPEAPFDSAACPSEEDLLAHVSGSSPSAHTQLLLAHIDCCDACRILVAEATRALSESQGQSAACYGGLLTLTPGEHVLDRYAIRRFIARGGMGEVYEAIDLLLDERVALKTLASSVLDDDRAALRFKGEARLARRVTHPNVCRILEFGVHVRRRPGDEDESVPFLTMEFLCGETLAQRISRRGRFATEDAVPLLRQVLAGLAAIHGAGIIHRDLKTDNIFLVAESGAQERAVVMDFGLARALDGSVLTTWPHLAGGMTGTLDCMAPEQIEGTAVGPPADVYAFGVLLFELLTGQRPFVKAPPAHRLLHPAPLASSVLPDLPPAWDAVIARCLAHRPAHRFATLADLVASLPGASAGPGGKAWLCLLPLLLGGLPIVA
jgi:serine/threonine protein kinase